MIELRDRLHSALKPSGHVSWKPKERRLSGLSYDKDDDSVGSGGLFEWFESVLRHERDSVDFVFSLSNEESEHELEVGPLFLDQGDAKWLAVRTKNDDGLFAVSAKLFPDDMVRYSLLNSQKQAKLSRRPEQVIGLAKSDRKSITPIHKQGIFWTVLAVFSAAFILSLYAAGRPTIDQFALTTDGLETQISTYRIPLSVVGVFLLIVAPYFTFQRLRMMHDQNERAIHVQQEESYQRFRSEFLETMNDDKYEFRVIRIPKTVLFANLYPRSESGEIRLAAKISEIISDNHREDFVNVMNHIANLSTQHPERYQAQSYYGAYALFSQLKNACPIDADVSFAGGHLSGEYAEHIEGTLKDVFYIFSVVNMLHGDTFFSNNDRRRWRGAIDRFSNVVSSVDAIDKVLNETGWWQALHRGEKAKLDGISLRGELQKAQRADKMMECDTDGARKYIYNLHLRSADKPSDELLQLVASKLNLEFSGKPFATP